ncbi:MAG: 16S rRNA (cytosine(1402)-N(4))-methyltransferase RsmH [Verrucomicrobiota bacterium]|nr:16S rRNA (cytosine(1402)-N(4))-methyltransferase RsmH [Verrucomicrobiota bacterium]
MTEFIHHPVLLKETLEALQPASNGVYADGTIGGGGHAAAILEASSPAGFLYGCDRDQSALEAAGKKLASYPGRFELHHGTFTELPQWVGNGSCDGILLDLGVSSPQLDKADRGFSFQQDGPLDMRMDRSRGITAAELVNQSGALELARIFWEFGDEQQARKIAQAIESRRKSGPIETTKQLADLIEQVSPRLGRKSHPATKVFQALRIAVNQEMELLREGLGRLWSLLKVGGRFAIITFHSLEDRIVKEFGRKLEKDYTVPGEMDIPELRIPRPAIAKWVKRKPILASDAELKSNPRARSAQLRVLIKLVASTDLEVANGN